MLTQLHLESLKCFEALALPLAPLTLLTGFNAAGKSTALQAPLLLAQALRTGLPSRHLSLNGPLVQMGTIGEILNRGPRHPELAIGAQNALAQVIWHLDSEDRGARTTAAIVAVDIADTQGRRKLSGPTEEFRQLFPVSQLNSETRSLLDDIGTIVFISAVRDGAREIFPSPEISEPIHADVGVRGELAPWWFAQLSDEDVPEDRRHPGDPGATLRRQVGAWAGEMFSGAEANARYLERTGLVQLQFRTRITEDWRRPANVGYGLTYAFPILVAGLLAQQGQTIIIDSPEAHLHPRAQSRMGGFLSKMAAAGVQVIVETHSDHVLNGVRLAVKHRALMPEAALIHFFTRQAENAESPAGSTPPEVVAAHIDEVGGITTWPDGFFDQAERDISRLADWA